MVKQKRKKRLALLGCLVLAALAALCFARAYHLLPERTYTAEDFGIPVAVSPVDFNGNGVDDYADLVLGARQDAKNHPRYDGAYQPGGYPPDDIGVCTDVIWRAFRQAGYCLRDMVDADIAARPAAYPQINEPDSDIDFRRVPNLHCFFAAYGQSLTCDTTQIDQFSGAIPTSASYLTGAIVTAGPMSSTTAASPSGRRTTSTGTTGSPPTTASTPPACQTGSSFPGRRNNASRPDKPHRLG